MLHTLQQAACLKSDDFNLRKTVPLIWQNDSRETRQKAKRSKTHSEHTTRTMPPDELEKRGNVRKEKHCARVVHLKSFGVIWSRGTEESLITQRASIALYVHTMDSIAESSIERLKMETFHYRKFLLETGREQFCAEVHCVMYSATVVVLLPAFYCPAMALKHQAHTREITALIQIHGWLIMVDKSGQIYGIQWIQSIL